MRFSTIAISTSVFIASASALAIPIVATANEGFGSLHSRSISENTNSIATDSYVSNEPLYKRGWFAERRERRLEEKKLAAQDKLDWEALKSQEEMAKNQHKAYKVINESDIKLNAIYSKQALKEQQKQEKKDLKAYLKQKKGS
ncbi:hypothetical protein BSLG_006655 [Batrachochytrium salamandrivorans]|nr:hypothetical protein BSLG_006655 [Batrachochytrium salamandrivorans]